jgi:metal-responsive CopG/Arc/MetJ family transcriptional regulator
MSRTTKVSISVPSSLLARADELLGRPGEGRSALFARVLDEAVRTAEEAQIDAQYERAFREHAISQADLDRTNALARAAIRGTRRARRTGGAAV